MSVLNKNSFSELEIKFDAATGRHFLLLTPTAGPEVDPTRIELDIEPMALLEQLSEMSASVQVPETRLQEVEHELFLEILDEALLRGKLLNESTGDQVTDTTVINYLTFGVSSWDNGCFPDSNTLSMATGRDGSGRIEVELDDESPYPLDSIDGSDNYERLTELRGNFRHDSFWRITLRRGGSSAPETRY